MYNGIINLLNNSEIILSKFLNSQFLTFNLISFKSFIFLFLKFLTHSISSNVSCSCVFFTKIVLVENGDKLNSDFEKLKLVIFSFITLVFSPS